MLEEVKLGRSGGEARGAGARTKTKCQKGSIGMSHIDVVLVGPSPPESACKALLRALTDVLVERFERPRETVTARLVHSEIDLWAVGGELLPAGTFGAMVVMRVLEGAAGDAAKKSAAVAQATAAIRQTVGTGDLPLHVLVDPIPAQDWGFNGLILPALRLPRRAN